MLKKIALISLIMVSLGCHSTLLAADTKESAKDEPILTDPISSKYGFTLQEEKEIGFQSAIILSKKYGYYNNLKVNRYVNKVGKSIAEKVSKRPGITYNFFVLNTPEINAFAVPGGFIFITKGALKVLSNEAELAGILAHEIAHIELGHGLQAISSNPEVRDKVRILKVNLQQGKGLTQQSFKDILTKEKDVTSGIVNSGNIKPPASLKETKKGFVITGQ